jgi:hypothetical protein
MKAKPVMICLTETFLDESVNDIELEGYIMISRRDRGEGDDDRKCGGVAVFAMHEHAERMTEIEKSKTSERVWIVVHSDMGPFLIGNWYRPPVHGPEVSSIASLREEWNALSQDVVGTIIGGDMNIHHRRWLKRSARNSAEGEELHRFCLDSGTQQLVREATRGEYLLDLVLSDVEGVRCTVLPKIADHGRVLAQFKLTVPETVCTERLVWWRYSKGRLGCITCRDLFNRLGRVGLDVSGFWSGMAYTENLMCGGEVHSKG